MILSLEARARGAEARLAQADAGSAGAGAGASTPRKKTRVYIDGCFDLMHFGHRCVYVCVCMCDVVWFCTAVRCSKPPPLWRCFRDWGLLGVRQSDLLSECPLTLSSSWQLAHVLGTAALLSPIHFVCRTQKEWALWSGAISKGTVQ